MQAFVAGFASGLVFLLLALAVSPYIPPPFDAGDLILAAIAFAAAAGAALV